MNLLSIFADNKDGSRKAAVPSTSTASENIEKMIDAKPQQQQKTTDSILKSQNGHNSPKMSQLSVQDTVSSSCSGKDAVSVQLVHPSTNKDGAISKESTSQNLHQLPPLPIVPPATRGKVLGLIETNHLELDISKMVENAYKYDVEITSKGPKKLYSAAFSEFCAQFLPEQQHGISYDGKKIALANCRLSINSELVGEVQVKPPDTGKMWDFTVAIKPANDGASVPLKRAFTE